MLRDVLGRPVEAGMVRPLVDDAQVARELAQRCHSVFGEDGQAQAVDEFRNAVVDFRVDVVRASAEDDGPLSRFFQVVQDFLCQIIDFLFIRFFFVPSGSGSGFDFVSRQVPSLQLFCQALADAFLVVEGQEGAQVGRIGFGQAFAHVVADDFGIAHDHGAVEGVVFAAFAGAILDARIEDAVDAFFQQVFDVAVDQFGRVAGRIRRDRVHRLFKEGF